MPESFDRLLNLAKKTGNNLIVYDRDGGEHLVIMGVEEYEDLIDGIGMEEMFQTEPDVRALTEGELLDKINRDIALWREVHVTAESTHQAVLLEKELHDDPFDPFEEDHTHSNDWHRVGEVLAKNVPEVTVPVPQATPQESAEETPDDSEAELLGDEPIFFEEPVE